MTEQWKTICAKNFDALMTALSYADSKGFMPDAISAEWKAFDWQDPSLMDESPDAEIAPMQGADQAEDTYVIKRLSGVLADVAAALFGEEADGDAAELLEKLPERAQTLMVEVELYRAGIRTQGDSIIAHPGERVSMSWEQYVALTSTSADDAQPVAISEVLAERKRQDAQWGGPAHDDEHAALEWLSFIDNQTDKAIRETAGWLHESSIAPDVRVRLVKIAALAVAAIESIDRAASATRDK